MSSKWWKRAKYWPKIRGSKTQNCLIWRHIWFPSFQNQYFGSVNHLLLNKINQRYVLDKIWVPNVAEELTMGQKGVKNTKSPILMPYLISKFPKSILWQHKPFATYEREANTNLAPRQSDITTSKSSKYHSQKRMSPPKKQT